MYHTGSMDVRGRLRQGGVMDTPWLLELLACPLHGCGAQLVPMAPDVLSCSDCGAPYPILGDVPVLVPNPGAWVAGHRDAVLASLAERGHIEPGVISLVDTFAEAFPNEEPRRFGDDWTAAELRGEPGTDPVPDGDGGGAFAAFLGRAGGRTPADVALELLAGTPAGPTLEIGPGAGLGTERLARVRSPLIVGDLSLRSVLVARDRAAGEVAGVVLDAAAPPFAAGRLAAVVAINVLDLLDDPEALLDGLAVALEPGGRLVLTAPCDLDIEDTPGLHLRAAEDGVAWVRAHGPRRFEVYLVRAVAADRVS